MKNEFKIIAVQALCINFIITLANGIVYGISYLAGNNPTFDGLYPISSILVSVLTAMCTLVFQINFFKKKSIFIQIPLHYLLLAGIVYLINYLFKWVSGWGYLYLGICFTVIYVIVWLITIQMRKRQDEKMNLVFMKNKEDSDDETVENNN